MVDTCTGGDVRGEGDTLSGIGHLRSIHGGYPCTGGDERKRGIHYLG